MRSWMQTATNQWLNQGQVQLGKEAVIDAGVTLGYPSVRDNHQPLIIGPDARIRCGSIVYLGTRIGSRLETGHNVVIRENNTIGDGLRIWSNSVIDYGCVIGSNVKVHHNVYIAQFTTVEDDAFLGPGVDITNDIHPGCPDALACVRGPLIKHGAQLGANVTVLPRVVIGEYAVVGAGSVVTRDIPPGVVAYGNPARVRGKIEDLVCTTGLRDKPYSHLLNRLQEILGSGSPEGSTV